MLRSSSKRKAKKRILSALTLLPMRRLYLSLDLHRVTATMIKELCFRQLPRVFLFRFRALRKRFQTISRSFRFQLYFSFSNANSIDNFEKIIKKVVISFRVISCECSRRENHGERNSVDFLSEITSKLIHSVRAITRARVNRTMLSAARTR